MMQKEGGEDRIQKVTALLPPADEQPAAASEPHPV